MSFLLIILSSLVPNVFHDVSNEEFHFSGLHYTKNKLDNGDAIITFASNHKNKKYFYYIKTQLSGVTRSPYTIEVYNLLKYKKIITFDVRFEQLLDDGDNPSCFPVKIEKGGQASESFECSSLINVDFRKTAMAVLPASPEMTIFNASIDKRKFVSMQVDGKNTITYLSVIVIPEIKKRKTYPNRYLISADKIIIFNNKCKFFIKSK